MRCGTWLGGCGLLLKQGTLVALLCDAPVPSVPSEVKLSAKQDGNYYYLPEKVYLRGMYHGPISIFFFSGLLALIRFLTH